MNNEELNMEELELIDVKQEELYNYYINGEFEKVIERGQELLNIGLYNESTRNKIIAMMEESKEKLAEQKKQEQNGFHL